MPDRGHRLFYESISLCPLFKNSRIIEKTGTSILPRAALREPGAGNILVIGDAAACIEVENQGAMMCGFKAGNAVYEELHGGDGFNGYAEWWKRSFEFNDPELLKGLAVIPALNVNAYTDDDIDYLFSLVDGEDIPGTCSQYRSGVAKWKAMLGHSEKIKQERRDLYEKVKGVMDLNFQ